MFAAMGVMTILLKYGCLIKWKNAAYMCARAFMRAELIAALEMANIFILFLEKRKKRIYSKKYSFFCGIIYVVWLFSFLLSGYPPDEGKRKL